MIDSRKYWIARHDELQGDVRAVGNRTRSSRDVLRVLEDGEAKLDRILRDSLPHGASALDLGCGTGRLHRLFDARGWRYRGVDISPTAIEQAIRGHSGGDFICDDIASYYDGERYDAVICWSVLLHMVDDSDWRSLLSVAAKHLSGSGFLIIADTIPESRPVKTAPHCVFRTQREYHVYLRELGMTMLPNAFSSGGQHGFGGFWLAFHHLFPIDK